MRQLQLQKTLDVGLERLQALIALSEKVGVVNMIRWVACGLGQQKLESWLERWEDDFKGGVQPGDLRRLR